MNIETLVNICNEFPDVRIKAIKVISDLSNGLL